VALAFGTMIFAGAVGDWRRLADINDPLPQAMKMVVGDSSGWLHMLVWIGLFGLIASFHGIIMGYSRQIFALAREGFLPAFLADLSPSRKTPHWAILAGGAVGIAAIWSDSFVTLGGQPLTANIVTMSVLGALTMYIFSMAALFALRRREPELVRPFRAPLYPLFPALAMGLAAIALAAIIYYNALVSGLFAALFAAALPLARRGTTKATRIDAASTTKTDVKPATPVQP
jgi:ethanolamine permease